jgi:aryl-phospho-beta-D-glucosidase BglC (GH1 family)
MEHFASYITEKDAAYIASLGMDHIRLGFDQIVLERAPFEYREEILELLRRFVSWCQRYDLGIVLNMHKALGNYCDISEEVGLMRNDELRARFIALWLELEKTFANAPTVMFELLNEVVGATAEEWNALANETICALRRKNPTRKIIVGCVDWGNPPALPQLGIWEDENVIYTFHCYAPHEFTHQQGVLQASHLYYNRKMPYPCDDIERYREYHRLWEGNDRAYAAGWLV